MNSDCTIAEELYDLVPFQAVQWIYTLFSVASFVLVVYTLRRYLNRTIFENVTKELIIALFFFISAYSLSFTCIQLAQLAFRYIATVKCDAQIPKSWCLIRYINTVIVCPLLVIHIGITAQHALSTFRFNDRTQVIVARIFIIISFMYPILLGLWAYRNESMQGRIPYCSAITASSVDVFNANLYFLLAMDIFNTLVSILLWKYNSRRFSKEQSFDLKLNFHLRQNLYAMQQFLPIAAVHAGIYGAFIVANYIIRSMRSSLSPGWGIFAPLAANIMPFYCFLCPLIFLVLIRRGRFERVAHVQTLLDTEQNSNQVYFAAYKAQWK